MFGFILNKNGLKKLRNKKQSNYNSTRFVNQINIDDKNS